MRRVALALGTAAPLLCARVAPSTVRTPVLRAAASIRFNSSSGGSSNSPSNAGRSSEPQPPPLTPERARAIGQFTLKQLTDPHMMYQQQLRSIAQHKSNPLPERWQALVSVWMNAQVHCLLHYGYAPTDEHLRSFILAYDGLSRTKDSTATELQQLTRERWNVLVREAFDVDLSQAVLPVEQARQVSSLLNLRMQTDTFLAKADEAMKSLGKDATDQAKQQALVGLLLPLQQEVAAAAGMEGDAGYVRMQVLLMQHAHDDTVAYNSMSGTLAVFRRAGINPQ